MDYCLKEDLTSTDEKLESRHPAQIGPTTPENRCSLGISRYGRTRKAKISQDFCDIDDAIEGAVSAKNACKRSYSRSPVRSPRKFKCYIDIGDADENGVKDESKTKYSPASRYPKILHVTGDSISYEDAEENVVDRPMSSENPLRTRKFFKTSAEGTKLQTMTKLYINKTNPLLEPNKCAVAYGNQRQPVNSDRVFETSAIDVSKVLKIISSKSSQPRMAPRSCKPALRTYSNKRKHFNKSTVIESFGLPDEPIIPLDEEICVKPLRISEIDVDSAAQESVNIADRHLIDIPWGIKTEDNGAGGPVLDVNLLEEMDIRKIPEIFGIVIKEEEEDNKFFVTEQVGGPQRGTEVEIKYEEDVDEDIKEEVCESADLKVEGEEDLSDLNTEGVDDVVPCMKCNPAAFNKPNVVSNLKSVSSDSQPKRLTTAREIFDKKTKALLVNEKRIKSEVMKIQANCDIVTENSNPTTKGSTIDKPFRPCGRLANSPHKNEEVALLDLTGESVEIDAASSPKPEVVDPTRKPTLQSADDKLLPDPKSEVAKLVNIRTSPVRTEAEELQRSEDDGLFASKSEFAHILNVKTAATQNVKTAATQTQAEELVETVSQQAELYTLSISASNAAELVNVKSSTTQTAAETIVQTIPLRSENDVLAVPKSQAADLAEETPAESAVQLEPRSENVKLSVVMSTMSRMKEKVMAKLEASPKQPKSETMKPASLVRNTKSLPQLDIPQLGTTSPKQLKLKVIPKLGIPGLVTLTPIPRKKVLCITKGGVTRIVKSLSNLEDVNQTTTPTLPKGEVIPKFGSVTSPPKRTEQHVKNFEVSTPIPASVEGTEDLVTILGVPELTIQTPAAENKISTAEVATKLGDVEESTATPTPKEETEISENCLTELDIPELTTPREQLIRTPEAEVTKVTESVTQLDNSEVVTARLESVEPNREEAVTQPSKIIVESAENSEVPKLLTATATPEKKTLSVPMTEVKEKSVLPSRKQKLLKVEIEILKETTLRAKLGSKLKLEPEKLLETPPLTLAQKGTEADVMEVPSTSKEESAKSKLVGVLDKSTAPQEKLPKPKKELQSVLSPPPPGEEPPALNIGLELVEETSVPIKRKLEGARKYGDVALSKKPPPKKRIACVSKQELIEVEDTPPSSPEKQTAPASNLQVIEVEDSPPSSPKKLIASASNRQVIEAETSPLSPKRKPASIKTVLANKLITSRKKLSRFIPRSGKMQDIKHRKRMKRHMNSGKSEVGKSDRLLLTKNGNRITLKRSKRKCTRTEGHNGNSTVLKSANILVPPSCVRVGRVLRSSFHSSDVEDVAPTKDRPGRQLRSSDSTLQTVTPKTKSKGGDETEYFLRTSVGATLGKEKSKLPKLEEDGAQAVVHITRNKATDRAVGLLNNSNSVGASRGIGESKLLKLEGRASKRKNKTDNEAGDNRRNGRSKLSQLKEDDGETAVPKAKNKDSDGAGSTLKNSCNLANDECEYIQKLSKTKDDNDDTKIKSEVSAYEEDSPKQTVKTEAPEGTDIWKYKVGDIMWAKVGSHPYWPCLIANEPTSGDFRRNQKRMIVYHVRFFGDNGRRSWVPVRNLLPYNGPNELKTLQANQKAETKSETAFVPPQSVSKYRHWKLGVSEAESLKGTTVEERFNFFFEMFATKREKKMRLSNETDADTRKIVGVSRFKVRSSHRILTKLQGAKVVKKERSQSLARACEPKEADDERKPLTRRSVQKISEDRELTSREVSDITQASDKKQSTPQRDVLGSEYSLSDTDSSSKWSINSPIPFTLESQTALHKRNNLFKGVSRERVCQICEKNGTVVKCKGRCSGYYHISCAREVKRIPPHESNREEGRNDITMDMQEVQINSTENTVIDRKDALDQEKGASEVEKRLDVMTVEKEGKSDVSTVEKNGKLHAHAVVRMESSDFSSIDRRDVPDVNEVEIIQIKDRKKSSGNSPKLVLNSDDPCFKKLPLLEQIDTKMKEVMKKFEDKTHYADSTTDYTSSEESVPEGNGKNVLVPHVTGDSEVADKPTGQKAKRLKPRGSDASDSPTSDLDFKCNDCLEGIDPVCFVCHEELSRTSSSIRQKCSIFPCGKFYHPECLKVWPQTQWSLIGTTQHKQSNKTLDTFVCPLHVCHTCVSDDPRAAISRCTSDKVVKCLRCPATYHTTNYCVPAGTEILTATQIVCPRHWGPVGTNKKKKLKTVNTTWCFICSEGGDLICCETCPTSVHVDCLAVNLRDDDSFVCEDCETGRFPLYDEIVWVKLGSYRWWPAVILFPNEIPDNVRNLPHNKGEFVVKFFGTHDHYWIGRGRVFLFQEGDTGGHSVHIRKKVDAVFKRSVEEATEAHRLKKDFKVTKEAEIKTGLKPPPYIKIKVNRPVGNVRQFDGNISNTTPCECDPKQRNPCGPDSDCLNRLLLTECDPEVCPAGEKCQNQNFEKRRYPPLLPYKTQGRGWGLKSPELIKRGQFVIEYVGEMIDEQEYQRRIKKMHEQKEENYYFLTIDKDRMLDAGPKGNAARFMNHSCQPNCETQKWTVNGDTRVGLFATVDVPASTELTFNYNLECVGKEKKICRCGASNCSGYIGLKVKTEESHKKPKKSLRKLKIKKKKRSPTPPAVSVADDPCFVCGKTENVSGCHNKVCTKYYHLKCVNLDARPENKWVCPWHNCNICSKRTIRCCVKCISSYCPVHSEGNVRYDKLLGFVCSEHDPTKESQEIQMPNLKKQEVVTSKITEENDVTSTTCDEVEQTLLGVGDGSRKGHVITRRMLSGSPKGNKNKETATEAASLTPVKGNGTRSVADAVTSTPVKGDNASFAGELETLANNTAEHKLTDCDSLVKPIRKRGRPKKSATEISKKFKLDKAAGVKTVVKPQNPTPNLITTFTAQNEIILSSTVPTRHLRASKVVNGEESDRFLKRHREYEKDLPIRKRSTLRCESAI